MSNMARALLLQSILLALIPLVLAFGPRGSWQWQRQPGGQGKSGYGHAGTHGWSPHGDAGGYTTIHSPGGATIRYKEPGKSGICETTPNVNSYSGYIDLAPNVHIFFWFFESRRNPAKDDFTLWLNGGPGSDSLYGLFDEHGPCRVTADEKTIINLWSWNNVSNMLYLSQPVGTGFSYQYLQEGSLGAFTQTFLNASQATPDGVYPVLDPFPSGTISTTDLAAVATWNILQAFLGALPRLQGNRAQSRKFNFWTESYGGHYGPSFFEYFQQQNAHASYPLEFNSLGIINGIVDYRTQASSYPEFAVNNTYGIKAYDDATYNYATRAVTMPGGCYDQIDQCQTAASDVNGGFVNGRVTQAALANPTISQFCEEAMDMCLDNVEGPYYNAPDARGVYDIRHPINDPTPPDSYWIDYLNQPSVQQAIGVNATYVPSNTDVFVAFGNTGDIILPNFILDLQDILNSGVRVTLAYGDADYICNWFGGQAVSLAVNYTHQAQFNAAGYAPFDYLTQEYGETREYGNFSFTRVYESGHMIPYYQPQAAFALFYRSISGLDIAQGKQLISPTYDTNGPASATHTEPYAATPDPNNAAAGAAYTSSLIAYYASVDAEAPPKSTGS